VELAAQALNTQPERIAKTLSFRGPDGPLLIVAAGHVRIDNKKFREAFGFKGSMLTPEEAESLIGHRVGGICPFGVKEAVRTYLDVSLREFDIVFPACGSSNSAIAMSPDELFEVSRAQGWVDVGKG